MLKILLNLIVSLLLKKDVVVLLLHFLALLELIKGHIIELVQSEPFAPIYVKPARKRSSGR